MAKAFQEMESSRLGGENKLSNFSALGGGNKVRRPAIKQSVDQEMEREDYILAAVRQQEAMFKDPSQAVEESSARRWEFSKIRARQWRNPARGGRTGKKTQAVASGNSPPPPLGPRAFRPRVAKRGEREQGGGAYA